jgi:hypothetical protein
VARATLALVLLLAACPAHAHVPLGKAIVPMIGDKPCGEARYDKQRKVWLWVGCDLLEELFAPIPADERLCREDSPLTCWKVGAAMVLGKCRHACECVMRGNGRWCAH